MAKKEKSEVLPDGTVQYRSRYLGLVISMKKASKDKDGKHVPGFEVRFSNGSFSTNDPEVIKFLDTREIGGAKTYGVDYWRAEEGEKYIHRVPKHLQQKELLRCKDDQIEALRKQLAEAKGVRE